LVCKILEWLQPITPAYESGGRRFESFRARQLNQVLTHNVVSIEWTLATD
jgi:hypothetical protein